MIFRTALLAIFTLAFGLFAQAQTRTLITDRAVIKDSIQIAGRWIYLVSTDSTFSAADHRSVPTTKAVKDFVEALPSGVSDFFVSNDTLYLITEDSTYFALLPDGADDWGTQTVQKDSTLRGNGTTLDPLRVNRDTFPTRVQVTTQISDSLSTRISGSGTANFYPVFTESRTIADGRLSQTSASLLTLRDSTGFRMVGGTTALRGSQLPTPNEGTMWWNTTDKIPNWYTGTAWNAPAVAATSTGLFNVSSVLFAESNGSVAGADSLKWDNLLNRLKIGGKSNLGYTFQVTGPASGVTAYIQAPEGNSASNNAMILRGANRVNTRVLRVQNYAGNDVITLGTSGEMYLSSIFPMSSTAPLAIYPAVGSTTAAVDFLDTGTPNMSGHRTYFRLNPSYNMSSGSGTLTYLEISPQTFATGSNTSPVVLLSLISDGSPLGPSTGILQSQTSVNNYFAGKNRIGSTQTPSQAIHVTGKVQIDTLTDNAASLAGFTNTSGAGVITRVKLGTGLRFSNDTINNTVELPSYQTLADSTVKKYMVNTIQIVDTDGSGDIVVTHPYGASSVATSVQVVGTTPYFTTVHTLSSGSFKVRVYNTSGTAVTSTAVNIHIIITKLTPED